MEKLAKALVIGLVLLAIITPIAGKQLASGTDVINLHARMPENGGWSIEVIEGQVDKPIKLRLTSDDVVHSFAVAKQDIPPIEILPGKYSQTELVFSQPGEYTFYCTRWCGANHWRMRGRIEIEAPEPVIPTPRSKPLFLQLDIDLDVPHVASRLPKGRPYAQLPDALQNDPTAWTGTFQEIWSSSPEQTFLKYRSNDAAAALDDQQIWNMVAWALSDQVEPGGLVEPQRLYTENCLACHGESGKGDGVMVRDLPALDYDQMGGEAVRPPDWSDP